MQFGILGPVEAIATGGRRLDLGAPRQRAVLTILLLASGRVVSVDRLIDDLWGDAPPSAATASLQAYVSNLRRVLEPARKPRTPATVLVTDPPGYALRVESGQIDADRFANLADDGRRQLAQGDVAGACRSLTAALALWRGPALADFAYEAFAEREANRLEDRRVDAIEELATAHLVAREPLTALGLVDRVVQTHPFRERVRMLQMRSLYHVGRQADALNVYEETRRLLKDELGLEPSSEFQALHFHVLTRDPVLDTPPSTLRGPSAPSSVGAPPPVATSGAFVGRRRPLAMLAAALDDAREARTGFVLVEGEPGIGKSRLVTEFARRAEADGAVVAWGRCHDDERTPPLWPWTQALRHLDGGTRSDAIASGNALSELVPELDDGSSFASVATGAAHYRLFDAVREKLSSSGDDRPVVIVLDDVHWADATSLRLLRFLAVELSGARVLTVATVRDGAERSAAPVADAIADLARQPSLVHIVLQGLDVDEVVTLIRSDAPLAEAQLRSVATVVHARTNGNPFFVKELVRLMKSEHALDDPAASGIPLAVGDVVRRRLGRLPDEVQTVLGVAAVAGREFDIDVLSDACRLDPDRVMDILDAAISVRLVVPLNGSRCRFSHAIVRETLYEDIAVSRRAALHGRVVTAIESAHRSHLDAHYTELVHHAVRGPSSLARVAIDYAELAAHEAARQLAYDDAAGLWSTALTTLERADDVTADERIRLSLELASAWRCAGRLADASRVLDAALEWAQESGDYRVVAEVALAYDEIGLWQVNQYGTVNDRVIGALTDVWNALDERDSTLRARLLGGLGVAIYYRDHERTRSLGLVRESAAMARRLGEPQLLAAALVELIVMLDTEPDQREQRAAAAELASIGRNRIAASLWSTVTLRVARTALAGGDATGLHGTVEAFHAEAVASRQPDEQLWSMWARTTVAFLEGRLESAVEYADTAFQLHQRVGIWGAPETYAVHMVLIWREQAKIDEVAPIVVPMLDAAVHPGARRLRALFALELGFPEQIAALLGPDPVPRSRDFTWLADACVTAELAAAGRLDAVSELYDLLAPFSARIVTMDGTFVCLGAAAYYVGLLADALGRTEEAVEHFERAVELNDAIGALPWAVRSRYRLAHHVDPERAQRLLDAAAITADTHRFVAMGRSINAFGHATLLDQAMAD